MAEESGTIQRAGDIHGERKEIPFVLQSQPQQEKKPEETNLAPISEKEKDTLELARAKLGVEEFKASYEAGDEEWKRLLRETDVGQELQAMYLGLRPAFSEPSINYEYYQTLLMKNISQRFGLEGKFVYDRDIVAKTLEREWPTFFDYSSTEQTVDEYMKQIAREEITDYHRAKVGLLLGFPPHAVDEWVSNDSIYSSFVELYDTHANNLSPEDTTLWYGYAHGYPDIKQDTLEEKLININSFRDEHQTELQSFLEKRVLSPLPDDTRNYLLTARHIFLPGFEYLSGNPTPEDKAFEQRVRDTFEQSGMNEYLASIKTEKEDS